MKREFTYAQKNAVLYNKGNLLVSAGAGSGKSTVLVERVIRRITREENPVNLDRMLILTFSKASSADLREKIGKALSEKIKENPNNKHILRQKNMLASANISTLDSFYYGLVDRYRFELGIPASSKIVDMSEVAEIENEAIESTLDYIASGKFEISSENLTELYRAFSKGKSISDAFINLYSSLSSLIDGIDTLKTFEQVLKNVNKDNFFNTTYGEIFKESTLEFFTHYKKKYEEALEIWNAYSLTKENYYNSYLNEIENADFIISELNKPKPSYTEVKKLIEQIGKCPLGRKKKGDLPSKELCDYYKKIRDNYHSELLSLKKNYYILPENMLFDVCKSAAENIDRIYRILKLFENEYSKLKKKMGILTFSDITRYALNLVNKDNSRTKIAEEISSLYDEVYIDEYQDTSPIQDTIINRISPPDSRFIVGDIKQCIYSFRDSDPTLFKKYKDDYTEYFDDVTGDATIFLSENFRCSEKIITTVNKIFNVLFKTKKSIISYSENDELHYGKEGHDESEPKVKFLLGDNNVISNTDLIISEVERLLDNGVKPGEILILCRKTDIFNDIYDILISKGIPCDYNAQRKIVNENDILILYSFLKVIDNYDDEVSTAAVLLSPIFNITLDELTSLRIKHGKNRRLYDILCESDNERIKRFIKDTNEIREISYGLSSDQIIHHLLDEYGIRQSLICRKGVDTKRIENNLKRLYDMALKSEAESFKGLHGFLSKLDLLLDSKNGLGGEQNNTRNNAVRLLTIHKSKGLEAPYVILGQCDSKLYYSSVSDKGIMFDAKLGLGLYERGKNGFVRFKTPITSAVSESKRKKELDEYMRLLYVAMTRAEKSLTVTASVKEPEKYVNSLKLKSLNYDDFDIYNDNDFLDWALKPLVSGDKFDDYEIQFYTAEEKDGNNEFQYDIDDVDLSEVEKIENKVRENIAFEYPFSKTAVIPAKLTVSKLKPDVIDELNETGTIASVGEYRLKKPQFDRSERKDGAYTGTATHLFMQFCNFENVTKYGIESEIERLVKDGFIDEMSAKAVSREHLTVFFNSELFREMQNAKYIERELRFNSLLPAEEFSETKQGKSDFSGERILVQGVIDCIYKNCDGDIILLDYKTDKFTGNSEAEFIEKLRQKHKTQLTYYKKCIENIMGEKVDKTMIYSFALGKAIDL